MDICISFFPVFNLPSCEQQLLDKGGVGDGNILDENGVELSAVNIRTEYGRESAVSDGNGKFKKTVPSNGKLICRLIGYEKEIIAIKRSSEIIVHLHPSRNQLKEVVVVGYGAQLKSRTVSVISTKAGKAASFAYSMQGKAPGLPVLNNTGMPGQRNIILVRGLSAVARKATDHKISGFCSRR